MRVTQVQVQKAKGMAELSAKVDGFLLWFRYPEDYALSSRGDPFLAAALLPAMLKHERLEIDPAAPVSPRLLAGVGDIQHAFRLWYPMFRNIEVQASVAEAPCPNPGIGCFFSGGVDGSYTLLKHLPKITHLIFAKGIDMQLENDALFAEALASNQRVADRYGKTLVPVSTNVRFFGHAHKPINWRIHSGSGLASIALASGLSRVYVASTYTYTQLFPMGSHVVTDRLWSSEATEIVHDGVEAFRSDKLRKIAEDPALLAGLRVCWQDAGYNCGKCEKCLRTMSALRALRVSVPTLPPLTSTAPVQRLRIYDDIDLTHFVDNERLAREANDQELQRALARCIRRYERKRLVANFDRLLLGGLLRRWLRYWKR
jgi:hypothetical protein